MSNIFISYRRDDAEGQAGRLYDDLAARFGRDSVFMDVAGIHPGLDFREAIDQGLSSCSVFLAVIGKNWLTATDSTGQRRLENPNDFVRLETAAALKRGNIPVIPVLVQGASMPRLDQLTDDLKNLTFRNAVEISHTRWSSDLEVLTKALESYIRRPAPAGPRPVPDPPPKPKRSAKWLLLLVALLLLAGSAYFFLPSFLNRVPDFSGAWLQTNPQTDVEKPDPPIRLRISQYGSQIRVQLSYTGVFTGRIIGMAEIKNARAQWTTSSGCGGLSTFVFYLTGENLVYEVTDKFPAPCGGHPAGVEHRPVAILRRVNR